MVDSSVWWQPVTVAVTPPVSSAGPLNGPDRRVRTADRRGAEPDARSLGAPGVRADGEVARGLPAQVTRLLGRSAELSELAERLGRARLVTLTGTPGIGKTRLAVELAGGLSDQYADGVALVELAAVSDPALVPGAVAAALSVSEAPGRSLTDALVARLGERCLLLVLDNCEHLVGACVSLVDALLRGCPELSILATSREPLKVAGETVWQVPSLSVPDAAESTLPEVLMDYEAVALFVERAGAVQPGFALSAYVAPAVAEICRRLDGIPLAIELAAARVECLTPTEIAGRLDDRFSLLTKSSTLVPRHQTLEAALDWSHDLLSSSERALLRRLSVFAGGFDLEAAEGVCAGRELEHRNVLDLLGGLVAKSLVVADTGDLPRARYRLLETIRAYAGARLEQAGEAARLREAHARYCLGLAEEAELQLTGPRQERWLERLDSERANLRAALEWSLSHGQSEWALRLAGALVLFWRVRCHFTEGRELLEAAVSAGEGAARAPTAKALWGAGFMALMAGDYDAAVEAVEESLVHFEELGDLQGRARSLLILGNCSQFTRDQDALSLLEESAVLAREAGDPWCLAHALGVAGIDHSVRKDLTAARRLFEECLVVARDAQDKQGLRLALLGLGSVALQQGDYRAAEPALDEALAVSRELGEDYSEAYALLYLGQLALGRGDYPQARDLAEEALALVREVGSPADAMQADGLRARVAMAEGDRRGARRLFEEMVGRAGTGTSVPVLQGLGELAAQEGDLDEARRLLEKALDAAGARGWKGDRAHALYGLGQLARGAGDLKRAAALHHEALQLRRQSADAPGIAASLEAVAGLAAHSGRHHHAARLLGAAEALRNLNGYARVPWELPGYEADVALLHEALPADELERAWAEGAALSVEDAVIQASKGRGRRAVQASGWSSLTESEAQLATLVADGLTNPEIAERMFMGLGTVKDHLSRIFSKLGVGGRSELARELWHRGRPPSNGDR